MALSRREFLAVAATTSGLLRCASTPASKAAAPKSVVVLGAGLSGLAAALELVEMGYDVRVLEAQASAGGRIRTIRAPLPEGVYVDAGAAHTVRDPDLVKLLSSVNLEITKPPRQRWKKRIYYKGGVRAVLGTDEEPLSEGPRLTAEEEKLGFGPLMEKYFGAPTGDLKDPSWPPPELASLDQKTAEQFLIERGSSPAYRRIVQESFCPNGDLTKTSALAVMREVMNIQVEMGWGAGRIAGGTDALPRALATKLGDRVIFGARVRRIEQGADGISVAFMQQGAAQELTAMDVVCALPGPIVGEVEIVPALPEDHRRALAELNMTHVTRVLVGARTRFWNARDEFGAVDTDLPIGTVRDETDIMESTAGVLGIYATSASADRLDAMSEDQRLSSTIEDMERVHPGLKEQLQGSASVCWGSDPLFKGAYAWLGLGQLTVQQAILRRPHGRIYFAGDYNSHRPGFMHGALSSAKRAVREISEHLRISNHR